MAYKNVLDDLKKCVDLETPSRVPCFPLGLEFDIRDAGFTHSQFRTDPDAMVQVGLNAIKAYDYDWFILHPDDLIEYENIGITVTDNEYIPPAVSEYLPATESTLMNLRLPADPVRNTRMALHLEGLRRLKAALGSEVCLTGRIAAPFSSVSLILGIEATLFLMMENPGLLRGFMDFLIEYNGIYAQLQLEAGADAIWLGDCVATSHFLSPKHYENFAAECADRSSRLIQEAGGLVFYHGSECSMPHLEIAAELSFDTVNIGDGIGIGEVKGAIGSRKCVMGNLDTTSVLRHRSPREVAEQTKDIVEKGRVNGGYIFCTGEGILRDTPRENVKAMVEAARLYGRYQ